MRPLLTKLAPLGEALGSMKLAIFCLVLLMVLVVYCTLAQVHLGTFGAVDLYIRSMFLYWTVPGVGWKIPVFPGGGLVGLLLAANLMTALVLRIEFRAHKLGLLLAHVGLLLLVIGEFITGSFAVESALAIEEGFTRNYSESQREMELALIDVTDAESDTVFSVPAALLKAKRDIVDPRLPVRFRVKRYYPNSQLRERGGGSGIPPAATAGIGQRLDVVEMPVVMADDQVNTVSVFIEVQANGTSLGTWLLSSDLNPQVLTHGGHRYTLAIRPTRYYLPFSLTLKDFTHDVYPGTDIPKNFSSLVRLNDPQRGEDRDVLIYMNHPLRYRGLTFYQASFGKNDTLSVLQVVRNPGWLLPYASCVLVAIGLLIHFLLQLRSAGSGPVE